MQVLRGAFKGCPKKRLVGSHADNTGSNPVGITKILQGLTDFGQPFFMPLWVEMWVDIFATFFGHHLKPTLTKGTKAGKAIVKHQCVKTEY
jgi:hypothetical protein